MKKLALLFILLVVPFGLALADVPDEAATEPADTESVAPPTSVPEESDASTCEYKSAKELLEEWRARNPQPASVPDCPVEEEDCSGGNLCIGEATCGVSGGPDYEDTGLAKCKTSQGVVSCGPNGTVHIQTNPCAQCPCCSAPIPCFCGPCGQFVRLVCQ